MGSNLKILSDQLTNYRDPETLVNDLLEMVIDAPFGCDMPDIEVNGVAIDVYDMLKEACIAYIEERL
jgi:hypothetical protein